MGTYKEWEDYFIEDTDVLKNKFDITDKEELKKKEAEVTLRKLVELYENPIVGDFDKEHLCKIHKYLFEDIYDFAGSYRTVYMAKGNSYFSGVDDIDWKLEYVLKEMNQGILNVNSKYEYACFLAGYYVDLIAIHPFREGNGRTTREFLREFVNSKNDILNIKNIPSLELDWSKVDNDKMLSGIRNSFFSKSELEMEFYKALVEIELIQNNSKQV